MNIAELVSERAAEQPRGMALIDGATGRRLDFGRFEEEAGAMAAALGRAGLEPGSRVLLMVPVTAELYVLLAGLLRAGCVAVFVDPAAGLGHLGAACRGVVPDAFIGVGRAHLLRVWSGPVRRIARHFVVGGRIPGVERLVVEGGEGGEVVPVGGDAAAVIRFTSGTTGVPKAVVRTHGYLRRQFGVLAQSLRLEAGERDMVTMPMFVMANLAAGVTSVLPRTDLRDGRVGAVDAFIGELEEQHVDRLVAAPGLLERVCDRSLERGVRLERVRKVFTGGAAVHLRLMDKLAEVFPGAAVAGVYGSTEAEPIALLAREQLTAEVRGEVRAGGGLPAGLADPAAAVRIFGGGDCGARGFLTEAAFEEWCETAGVAGEIVVSGPHVLDGYLDAAETAANKIRVGDMVWHRTGDWGRRDSAGRIWLLGRAAEVKAWGGEGGFHPLAIEALAMESPEVRQAAALVCGGRRLLCAAPVAPVSMPGGLVDGIVVLPSLPVDHRHRSRVDLGELRRRLKRVLR